MSWLISLSIKVSFVIINDLCCRVYLLLGYIDILFSLSYIVAISMQTISIVACEPHCSPLVTVPPSG